MSRYIQKIMIVLCMCVFGNTLFAQEKENEDEGEELGTESVNIIKAYKPTVSDAFKIKATPVLNDSVTQTKKEIKYSIFSIPVASTFTPIKGKAAAVDKPKRDPIYDNYATLGFGNFTSVLAEFYSNFQINRSDNLGIYLHHNSSQGGIEDLLLDDKFYNTSLDVNYTTRTRDFTYGIEAGVEHMLYNWYGLPEDILLTDVQLETIDPQQSYFGGMIGGKFLLDDAFVKKVEAKYRYFGDALSSKENHFKVQPTLEFEVGDELITTVATVDYLQGSFKEEVEGSSLPIEYQLLNLGINPSLVVLRDNLTVNLGAEVVYSIDNKNEDNNFYIYPKVTASYRLLEEAATAYAGIEGGLKQNTYRDAAIQNPYVSPNLEILPTHNQYNAYFGLKGKLSNVMSYNLRAGYNSETNKPLFVNTTRDFTPEEGYDYGNSFSYVYDDVETLTAYGELNFDISKQFKLGVTGEYFNYSTERQTKAWNLPEVKASVLIDYQINKQWYAGAQLFFIGERQDIDSNFTPTFDLPELITDLDSFFDANVYLGYRFTPRLSAFVKGNNLLGENYERWSHFPVQGIQVLGGVTYKFDF